MLTASSSVLLLFVYVFGGTLGAGLGGPSGGRAEYADYVSPGVILIIIASVAQGTSISVAMDMTGGIIARFRTVAISRASVLTGHVLGAMIQTMLAIAVVVGVALLGGELKIMSKLNRGASLVAEVPLSTHEASL